MSPFSRLRATRQASEQPTVEPHETPRVLHVASVSNAMCRLTGHVVAEHVT